MWQDESACARRLTPMPRLHKKHFSVPLLKCARTRLMNSSQIYQRLSQKPHLKVITAVGKSFRRFLGYRTSQCFAVPGSGMRYRLRRCFDCGMTFLVSVTLRSPRSPDVLPFQRSRFRIGLDDLEFSISRSASSFKSESVFGATSAMLIRRNRSVRRMRLRIGSTHFFFQSVFSSSVKLYPIGQKLTYAKVNISRGYSIVYD